MENTLILKYEVDKFFVNYNNSMKYLKINHNSLIFRVLKKIRFPLNIFYNKWKYSLNKYDKVIIFDTIYSNELTKYIKKKNPNIKVILWYWNSLTTYQNKNIGENDKNIDDIWTYNRFDASKHNLKYNPQFYSKYVSINDNKKQKDILFMGRNKNREKVLLELKENFNKYNLISDFLIINSEKELIKYEDYLNKLSNYKCILDIGNEVYCGLSLRPLEALFLKKKLITNNLDIVNYDFYNKNNIFVIGKDNLNDLKNFINSDYQEIDKKIIEKYDYESWIKRF